MLWMILMFQILSAQGGIYRQQLFDLQDARVAPPPAVVTQTRRATVEPIVDTYTPRPGKEMRNF
jgi:hypothetical protein